MTPVVMKYLFAFVTVLLLFAASSKAQSLPPSATSGALIFDDEFNGSAVDTNAWTVINRHGEYSQLETECNIPQEVNVANGTLIITTALENWTCGDFNPDGTVWHTPTVWPYVSGDIQWNNFNFTYGTVEIQAMFPNQDTGLWPAAWLLGSNCQETNPMTGETGVGTCPSISTTGYTEIDMTECSVVFWCHFGLFNPSEISPCDFVVPLNDGNMHVYDTTWTPTEVDQYMDGTQVAACSQSLTNPMFLIIQTQTGGLSVPNNAYLPANFYIDYVRVYANQYTTTNGGGPPPPQTPTPFSVTPSTLPNGTIGTAYSFQLVAAGGTAPYAWLVTQGSLPQGLSLSSSGLLSGTPTDYAFGTASGVADPFYVYCSDSAGNVVPNTQFYITINSATAAPTPTPTPAPTPTQPTPLTVAGGALPAGIVGTAYSTQLGVTGGTAPYRFVWIGGSLPSGLSLSSTGVLSGTPTGPTPGVGYGQAAPFYVYVSDAAYTVVNSTQFTIVINNQ
jgi:beta-glucanase (GH16 family)